MTNADVGTALRSCRIAAGLTQRQVAATLGVCHMTVGNHETGRTKVPVTLFFRYLELLHVTPEDFMAATAGHAAASCTCGHLKRTHDAEDGMRCYASANHALACECEGYEAATR